MTIDISTIFSQISNFVEMKVIQFLIQLTIEFFAIDVIRSINGNNNFFGTKSRNIHFFVKLKRKYF